MRYRIRYARFDGGHGQDAFDTLNQARTAQRDEIREMEAFAAPHGAKWFRMSVAEAFPGTTLAEKSAIYDVWAHVSWAPSKPEKSWIEREGEPPLGG